MSPEDEIKPFDRPTILHVGILIPHKGLEVLVKALAIVLKEVPDAQLLVVGSGEETYITALYMPKVREHIDKLGLGERIHFLGKLPNKEVLRLILKSNVVIIPEQYPNTFGPVILVEAMALGRPVIGSMIGSIPDFISNDENGLLARMDSPEEFAKGIIKILNNPIEASEMGFKARERINFTLGRRAIKTICSNYDKAMNEKPLLSRHK